MKRNNKFYILLFVSLFIYYMSKKSEEGFENDYKHSWALSNQFNYYRGLFDLKTRKINDMLKKNITNPVNNKISYYINRYI